MTVRFPHAKPFQVDDCEFLAAWELWFQRFHPGMNAKPLPMPAPNADIDPMPRLNAIETLDQQLIHNRRFSVDVLCRMLVRPPYRNTMHATNPFMAQNSHLLESVKAINPANGRSVNSAVLTEEGRTILQECRKNAENWTAIKDGIEARIDADIQVEVVKKGVVCEESLLSKPLAESIPYAEIICPHVGIHNSGDLVRELVTWIDTDPFQPMYRGNPHGAIVRGWSDRLRSYFWPNPRVGYTATKARLQPLLIQAHHLATALPLSVTNQPIAIAWANDVFIWGGVPQTSFTFTDVQNVISCAISGIPPVTTAPMNSGWTKIAAFATAHLESSNRSLVIWDSRVAHSIIRRIDALLSSNGHAAIPGYLKNIGRVPGRGGTRTTATYNLKWPDGYRSWNTVFAGSELVRKIRDELNKRGIKAPTPEGGHENWTVRTVEMVLFMDGY